MDDKNTLPPNPSLHLPSDNMSTTTMESSTVMEGTSSTAEQSIVVVDNHHTHNTANSNAGSNDRKRPAEDDIRFSKEIAEQKLSIPPPKVLCKKTIYARFKTLLTKKHHTNKNPSNDMVAFTAADAKRAWNSIQHIPTNTLEQVVQWKTTHCVTGQENQPTDAGGPTSCNQPKYEPDWIDCKFQAEQHTAHELADYQSDLDAWKNETAGAAMAFLQHLTTQATPENCTILAAGLEKVSNLFPQLDTATATSSKSSANEKTPTASTTSEQRLRQVWMDAKMECATLKKENWIRGTKIHFYKSVSDHDLRIEATHCFRLLSYYTAHMKRTKHAETTKREEDLQKALAVSKTLKSNMVAFFKKQMVYNKNLRLHSEQVTYKVDGITTTMFEQAFGNVASGENYKTEIPSQEIGTKPSRGFTGYRLAYSGPIQVSLHKGVDNSSSTLLAKGELVLEEK